MATPNLSKRGPTTGSRILVELPFGKSAKGKKQVSKLVRVKSGVARTLGLKPVTKLPTKSVKFKTAKGTATVTRLVQGSYRRRSVTLIFESDKKINGKNFKSVSLPLASGCSINDAVQYFSVGAGKSKDVIALITPDGQRIQWREDKDKDK